jgi:putative transposase
MSWRRSCSGRSASSRSKWNGLKKISIVPIVKKQEEIEPMSPEISISRQCELLGLPRSCFYYKPEGEDDVNLELMRLID